jgi:hypothetical protein
VGVVELPDRFVASAEVRRWLPGGLIVALPFDQVLPAPVVRFTVVKNCFEPPFLGFFSSWEPER